MEAAAASETESRTIADLLPGTLATHADRVAVRYKREGSWHEVTYAELGQIVQEIALGLIDLGIEAGERVSILANTRPEWSYVDIAATSAGTVVVPIYQTNSPEECHWVLSDSDACAVVCEDEEQLAKIAAVRDRLPSLRRVIVIDPPSPGANGAVGALQAITLDEVRERGRGRAPEELDARRAGVRPEDAFTFIYTSGTTGPPKGCVLTHRNYCSIIDMVTEVREITDEEVTYLYLPLAHSYALLVQLAAFSLGSTLAYFGGDTKQIVPELQEVKPTYLPSVPRVFEKIYTLAQGAIQQQSEQEQEQARQAIALGVKVGDMMIRGEQVPDELQGPFEEADERLFKNVRAIFGGNVRHATSGAAPIAHEILEFFYACGIPVFEGYGMTETATRRHRVHARAPPVRDSRARPPRRAAANRRRRRDPHKGHEHLRRLPQPRPDQLRGGGGRVAAHRRPRLDRRGRLPVDHRARRTSSSPPVARTSRRRTSRTTSSNAVGSPRP